LLASPLGSSSVLPMNKGKADNHISSFGSVQTAIIPPDPPVYDLAIDTTSWRAFRSVKLLVQRSDHYQFTLAMNSDFHFVSESRASGTPSTSSDHSCWQRIQNKPHRPWQHERRRRTVYQFVDTMNQLLVIPAKPSVHCGVL